MRQRILDLSFKNKLSHLSSTLTAVEILDEIFKKKNKEDIVVLSQGHAGLALYVILEKYLHCDAQSLLDKHGVHPCRDPENGIHVSAGSLGMGLTVALGMAMADKSRDVYCLISDGECCEGSVWEALRLARDLAPNLKVYVNDNGQTAFGVRSLNDRLSLKQRLQSFLPSVQVRVSRGIGLKFTRGVESHYHVITPEEYENAA